MKEIVTQEGRTPDSSLPLNSSGNFAILYHQKSLSNFLLPVSRAIQSKSLRSPALDDCKAAQSISVNQDQHSAEKLDSSKLTPFAIQQALNCPN